MQLVYGSSLQKEPQFAIFSGQRQGQDLCIDYVVDVSSLNEASAVNATSMGKSFIQNEAWTCRTKEQERPLVVAGVVSGVVAAVLLGLAVVQWQRRRPQKTRKEQTVAVSIETKEEPGHEPSHHHVNTPKF